VITSDQPHQIQFRLANPAQRTTVEQIVDDLPAESTPYFYDSLYPSPSDPGLYLCVERSGAKDYTLIGGNHGWTLGPRTMVDRETVVDLLWVCRVENSQGGPSELSFFSIRNPYSPMNQKPIASTRDTDIARYARRRISQGPAPSSNADPGGGTTR
jgi:hypothetical protein